MRKIIVSNIKENNNTLINYIKQVFPNLSDSMLFKALRNKDIKVNSKRTTDKEYHLNNGDTLEVFIDDLYLYGFPKELDIVYEDDNILVVYKPQGLLSNNEGKKIEEPTFEEFVQKKLGSNIHICHRLDRNTSGLLVFTKNDTSYEEMLSGFKNGNVNKEYIAYVYDHNFKSKHTIYESYLLKNDKDGFSKIYTEQVPGSQKIITETFVEKVDKQRNYAILRVRIHTGKTHQIRAQLSFISHPIIGDSKYGKNDINRQFKKYKQMLYAVKYTFNFPEDSILNYLNSTQINLDEKFYIDKL